MRFECQNNITFFLLYSTLFWFWLLSAAKPFQTQQHHTSLIFKQLQPKSITFQEIVAILKMFQK